jgi:F0F1-type ATP synthase epsilon subunit
MSASKAKAHRHLDPLPDLNEPGAKPSMYVKVYSPFKVFFEEPAYSISGINGSGPFDVLPGHHNFITLLERSEMIIKPVNTEKTVKILISGGIMHVRDDKVTVFLNV